MILVVLGPPGAGKGTQAHFLSERFNIPHVSTGELLREHMRKKTAIGQSIQDLMDKGQLVPDDTVTKVLSERISDEDCKNGFIMDGYPRTLTQAKNATSIVGTIDWVINVAVEDAVIIERMSGRRICPSCGATFHLIYKLPASQNTCDVCGATLTQRVDDKAKTVKNRLDLYHQEANPIIAYFDNLNKLINVDGSLAIEQVTLSIVQAVKTGSD